jgi:hypothetical protein
MKHLKPYTLFELRDNTYLSAADRLEQNHPERAKSLRKWVDDKYTVDINYLDPRPLSAMNSIYYVTDVSVQPSTEGLDNAKSISVTLESVNDFYHILINNYKQEGNEYIGILYSMRINGFPYYSTRTKKSGEYDDTHDKFYFSDRSSARSFIDIVQRESGEKLLFTINDIYKS